MTRKPGMFVNYASTDNARPGVDMKHTMKKPNQAKKKTRPYLLKGLSRGMERAFLLMGFTSGADHREEIPMMRE